MKTSKIDWTRINNDVNGNPRYVCHFFNIPLTEEEKKQSISGQYATAVKKANGIGGKKFSNKQYGGGIVFQSYNIHGLEEDILEFTGR